MCSPVLPPNYDEDQRKRSFRNEELISPPNYSEDQKKKVCTELKVDLSPRLTMKAKKKSSENTSLFCPQIEVKAKKQTKMTKIWLTQVILVRQSDV